MRTLGRFLVWTIVIVGLLVGILRAVAFRWFRLPTNDPIFETSVLPTLAGGDLIVAMRITRPTFGDLVVCPEPNFPERIVIGRVVGEAGDTVRIEDGQVLVNGQRFIFERACEPPTFTYPDPNNDALEVTQPCEWEALANHLHKTGAIGSNKVTPITLEVEVTEGMFFLASDNRLHPYDSRDFGLVDAKTCKETVVARLVSREGWMDSARRLDYIQ